MTKTSTWESAVTVGIIALSALANLALVSATRLHIRPNNEEPMNLINVGNGGNGGKKGACTKPVIDAKTEPVVTESEEQKWNVENLRALVRKSNIEAAEGWANDKTLEILANAFDVCIFVYQASYSGHPPFWNEIGYGDCKNKSAIFMHGNNIHFQILRPTISRAEAALEASNALISKVNIESPEGQRQIQDVLKLFTLVDVPGDGNCGYHAFARQINKFEIPLKQRDRILKKGACTKTKVRTTSEEPSEKGEARSTPQTGGCRLSWDCGKGEYCTGSVWDRILKKGACTKTVKGLSRGGKPDRAVDSVRVEEPDRQVDETKESEKDVPSAREAAEARQQGQDAVIAAWEQECPKLSNYECENTKQCEKRDGKCTVNKPQIIYTMNPVPTTEERARARKAREAAEARKAAREARKAAREAERARKAREAAKENQERAFRAVGLTPGPVPTPQTGGCRFSLDCGEGENCTGSVWDRILKKGACTPKPAERDGDDYDSDEDDQTTLWSTY